VVSKTNSDAQLNYFIKSPLFMATCVFGFPFIVLGTTAANSVAFAQNVFVASNAEPTPGKVFAVALAGNTFCCLLHSISRRWGIILNNVLGSVKFLMLLFIILVGFIWVHQAGNASTNLETSTAFQVSPQNGPRLPYRYAEAILFVMFAFGGFHQVNYVSS
jgi:amino acid transporter